MNYLLIVWFSYAAVFRYHCYYDEVRNEHDPKEEFEFEEQAKMFLASYKEMQKKYQNLLLKQSQVRLNKLFLIK